MKTIKIFPAVLALCLLLTGCTLFRPSIDPPPPYIPTEASTAAPETATPTETAALPTETPTEDASSAFTAVFPECSDTVLAFIYNEPFTNGEILPTEFWNNAPYERLLIVPRYPGSTVQAWGVTLDEEGWIQMSEEPTYTSVSEEGSAIGACLERPEGGPAWYVSVEAPDGSYGGIYLNFDGRYGTPGYEFVEDYYRSALITEPSGMEDWNPQFDEFGEQTFWSFWRAATRQGLDPWEAAEICFSRFTELGDSAAFTWEEGDMEGDTFYMKAARFHENYVGEAQDVETAVANQYELYSLRGNQYGILGPTTENLGEELWYQLTGVTVFDRNLTAKTVEITVDGEPVGSFQLTQGDFCTLIPLDLAPRGASLPLVVEVTVTETWLGDPDQAILQVYCGLDSNISGAR